MTRSHRKAAFGILISFLLFSPFFISTAATLHDVPDGDGGWVIAPAINGGYNQLLTGYEGYKNLGNLGLDLYAQPGMAFNTDDWVDWRSHTLFRLSANWFPLQVPDGVNGVKEDIYSVDLDYLYAFNLKGENRSWYRPFLGFGFGYYRDQISLDTPATGKVTSSDTHLGFEVSAGVMCPVWKRIPVRLIPEIRYHRINFVNSFASNITYQLALCYWPGGSKK